MRPLRNTPRGGNMGPAFSNRVEAYNHFHQYSEGCLL